MSDRVAKLAELLAKARSLPGVPGVYLMKDAQGRVIYVGKASRLPDRVSSYFQPATFATGALGPRKQPMLDIVEDFDVLECETEWEALLAENRLIKDLHPRFNSSLTDDKTFPYLVITMRDDYPGVYITREPASAEYRGARVFGPFTRPFALRQAMQMLQNVFKFRTCTIEIREDDERRRFFRPCLLYPIHRCTGPCAARISTQEYRSGIDRFIRFLESKQSVMIREMRQEMEQASAAQQFEKAAVLRDQMRALERLEQRGSRKDHWQPEAEVAQLDPRHGLESLRKTLGLDQPIRCVECIDIAHLQGGETVGSKVTFIDGRPLRSQYRRYRIQTAGNDDYAAIREVVSRRYREAGEGHELYPDVIIIDGGLGQLHAAQEAFNQVDVKPPMVIALAKKEELIFVQARSEPIRLSRQNTGLRLCQAIRDEAHRFAQHYHHILRRKKLLEEPGQTSTPGRRKRPIRQIDIPPDSPAAVDGDGPVQ